MTKRSLGVVPIALLYLGILATEQTTELATEQDLSFTIKKWGKPRRADIGSDLLISCKTNDPNANVTLNWTKKKTNWTNIETLPEFDGRIIKRGQIFRVKTLKTTDSGDFVCEAGNEQGKKAELFLGKVLVMEKKKYMQRHEEL